MPHPPHVSKIQIQRQFIARKCRGRAHTFFGAGLATKEHLEALAHPPAQQHAVLVRLGAAQVVRQAVVYAQGDDQAAPASRGARGPQQQPGYWPPVVKNTLVSCH